MGPGEVIRRLRMAAAFPRSQPRRGCAIRRTPMFMALAFFAVISAWAREPIVGNWQMISQKIGDSGTKPLPIMIKIRQEGSTKLTFTYVAGREQEVKMTFSAYLDATPAPTTNGAGVVIGTATLKKSGAHYDLVLQSRGRRPEPGTMTLSEHGNILTCQSTVDLPDRGVTRIVQVFSRVPK
jgi:hypothetical protein